VRWGFLPKYYIANGGAKAKELIKKVNREDIWKEAAKELGIPATDIPTSTSRGVEEFFLIALNLIQKHQKNISIV
jgi:bicarbonate transport system substrate-binding protein